MPTVRRFVDLVTAASNARLIYAGQAAFTVNSEQMEGHDWDGVLLLGLLVFTIFGQILFGLGRGVTVWIPVAAIAAMSFPVSQGCSNAIWQAKVAPDVQGRVFSARRFIAWFEFDGETMLSKDVRWLEN